MLKEVFSKSHPNKLLQVPMPRKADDPSLGRPNLVVAHFG